MPIYEYKCEKCGQTFDHLERTLSDAAKKCPKCGAASPVKQVATFSTRDGAGNSSGSIGTCSSGICSL